MAAYYICAAMAAAFAYACYAMAALASAPAEQSVPRSLAAHKSSARTPRENLLEVLSYVVSFSAFYLFVLVAMRLTKSPRFRRDASSFTRLLYSCAIGDDHTEYSVSTGKEGDDETPESFSASAMRLTICAIGIQISYLLWGLMQERIMTKPYESGELFRSSKVLHALQQGSYSPRPTRLLQPSSTSSSLLTHR